MNTLIWFMVIALIIGTPIIRFWFFSRTQTPQPESRGKLFRRWGIRTFLYFVLLSSLAYAIFLYWEIQQI